MIYEVGLVVFVYCTFPAIGLLCCTGVPVFQRGNPGRHLTGVVEVIDSALLCSQSCLPSFREPWVEALEVIAMHLSHAGGVFITSYLKTDLPMCRWNYPKDHKNPTITYTLFSRFEKKFLQKIHWWNTYFFTLWRLIFFTFVTFQIRWTLDNEQVVDSCLLHLASLLTTWMKSCVNEHLTVTSQSRDSAKLWRPEDKYVCRRSWTDGVWTSPVKHRGQLSQWQFVVYIVP